MFLGKGKDAISQGRFEDSVFESSTYSNRERYEFAKAAHLSEPRAIRDTLSFGWTDESFKVTDWLVNSGTYLHAPTTIAIGGQDGVVSEEGARKFCQAATECKMITLPKPKHDIFGSDDNDLQELLSLVIARFSAEH